MAQGQGADNVALQAALVAGAVAVLAKAGDIYNNYYAKVVEVRKDELTALRGRIDTLERRVDEKDARIDTLEREVNDLRTENTLLRRGIGIAEPEVRRRLKGEKETHSE